jgi:hypothetical protein
VKKDIPVGDPMPECRDAPSKIVLDAAACSAREMQLVRTLSEMVKARMERDGLDGEGVDRVRNGA